MNKIDNEIIPAKGTDNLVYLYLAGAPKKSRATYLFSLHKIARHFGALDAWSFDFSKLQNKHTTLIHGWLLEKYAPATAMRDLVAVKGILRKAFDLGLMDGDTYLRAIKPCQVRMPGRPSASTGRMLSPEELQSLLLACHRGAPTRSARDLAIITLLIYTGMRRAEVCNLKLADYDSTYFSADAGRLKIIGKGDKLRTMPIKTPRATLAAWIKLRGNKPGPLFLTIFKSDEISFQKMSTMSLWRMIRDRGRMVKLKPFTPHDIRRTFTSHSLERGIDLSTVASLMGHSNSSTTMGYDRRPEERKVDAVE